MMNLRAVQALGTPQFSGTRLSLRENPNHGQDLYVYVNTYTEWSGDQLVQHKAIKEAIRDTGRWPANAAVWRYVHPPTIIPDKFEFDGDFTKKFRGGFDGVFFQTGTDESPSLRKLKPTKTDPFVAQALSDFGEKNSSEVEQGFTYRHTGEYPTLLGGLVDLIEGTDALPVQLRATVAGNLKKRHNKTNVSGHMLFDDLLTDRYFSADKRLSFVTGAKTFVFKDVVSAPPPQHDDKGDRNGKPHDITLEGVRS